MQRKDDIRIVSRSGDRNILESIVDQCEGAALSTTTPSSRTKDPYTLKLRNTVGNNSWVEGEAK